MVACTFRPTERERAAAAAVTATLPPKAVVAIIRSPLVGVEYHWADPEGNRTGIATFDGEGRWTRRGRELATHEDPAPPASAVLLRVVLA